MAKAGFYTVESGKLSFRHDGHWYTDEERIDNPRIATLFSKSIRQNADGSFYLQVGDERAAITVEDTPYVVTTVEGDGAQGFMVVTNDGEREPLDPSTLAVGVGNVLYCRVKAKASRARFLRSAYYHLSDHFVAEAGGKFALVVAGRRYPVELESVAARAPS